jgi:hypothetical protein
MFLNSITLYHCHFFEGSTSRWPTSCTTYQSCEEIFRHPVSSFLYIQFPRLVNSSSTQFYIFTSYTSSSGRKCHLKQFITVQLAALRLARVMFSYWYLDSAQKGPKGQRVLRIAIYSFVNERPYYATQRFGADFKALRKLRAPHTIRITC